MIEQDTRAKAKRRKHDAAFKRELIERCLHPGASVSAIALESGLNANLLFKWRRMHLRSNSPGAREPVRGEASKMLPVMIRASAVGEMTAQLPMPRSPGLIEIDIGAARVRVRGAVDEANLRCVLQALGAQR
ncbi:MAG: transposase [Burkholderiaceae bacterium]|jgi:transposase|nr:transposase [Burkholderiaceae bacterium]